MESFNSYKKGLDLSFLMKRCIEHGRLVLFSRGDLFEKADCPSRLVGYVVKGCFKYNVKVGGVKVMLQALLLKASSWLITPTASMDISRKCR